MIGDSISHYEILEKLGQGITGVIHKAQDLKAGRLAPLRLLRNRLLRDQEVESGFSRKARDEVKGEYPIRVEHVEGEFIEELLFVSDASQTDPRCP